MSKEVEIKIKGMHCGSCEVLVERSFKKIPGVEKATVNHASGKAELVCSQEPSLNELNNAIKEHGYTVSSINSKSDNDNTAPKKKGGVYEIKREHLETGAIFLILLGLYFILKQFNILPKIGISDNMSYGVIFLVGLVAALSTCIAVTGGLLVSIATNYAQQHPTLTGVQKFKPHIYFNVGRIVSYTLLGGLIGVVGSVITPSIKTTGVLTIVASVVMILLGLNMLNISWFARFQPRMPKFIAHKIYDINPNSKAAPFLFGAGTFFLPCGFTQALQLYVLSKASFAVGALTMGAFSLGTLPALVSLGAVSSFAKGTFLKRFTKVAAVLVILLGIFSINNGLALTGSNIDFGSFLLSAKAQDANNVKIIDGKQIVELTVNGLSYSPNRFTIVQGVPVEWHIDGRNAQGCAQVIVAPNLGITEYVGGGVKTVTFTPQQTGQIRFSCSMGMAGPGIFNVIPNTQGVVAAPVAAAPSVPTANTNQPIANPGEVQKVSFEISRERGFYPNEFTVKSGMPVEVDIDAKIVPDGCMGVLVIPKYNVAHQFTLGQQTLTFTPTEIGTVWATCSMGGRMVKFNVV